MKIGFETVIDAATEAAAACVREEVFGREWQLALPQLPPYDDGQALTLIARRSDTDEPIATLSVVETTGNKGLHRRFGIAFYEGTKVARYTQLAVLKPFRGMKIPAQLILEARRRFVAPRRFAYTWLLFDADHAKGSSLCTVLGFKADSRTIQTEYGSSRVLVRDETGLAAEQWDRNAANYLDGIGQFNSAVLTAAAPLWARPALVEKGRGKDPG